MKAAKARKRQVTVTDFLNAVIAKVYRDESTVPQAVRDVWGTHGARMDGAAVVELAQSGAVWRADTALSRFRFTAPPGDIDPADAAKVVPITRPVIAPPDIPGSVTVRYPSFEVRYADASGCVRPLRRFTFEDVGTQVRTLDAEIAGRQNVRDWFNTLHTAMKRHKAKIVEDLPKTVMGRLDANAPFLQGFGED